jgi:uncharacterized protein YdcH (DUF465 family)
MREREFRTPITSEKRGRNGRAGALPKSALSGAGAPPTNKEGATLRKEIPDMKESILEEYLVNLETRHRDLDDTVSRLERRAYLTPTEQRTVTELKKEKLLTKDRIVKLKSTPPSAR